jgi:sodium/potassium-transporting ATPase subunit alpha
MHRIPLQEFYKRLGTDPEKGLTSEQAHLRLQKDGANALLQRKRESELVKFLRQATNLFAILLWVAAILSFIAERVSPGEGNLQIGAALIAVVLLNAAFSYYQQHRAEQIMAGFRDMLPATAKVMRDGAIESIPAVQLVTGDLILLEEGDRVPADSRLFEVAGLKVNNASLTGESEPQLRTINPTDKGLLESRNVVFSGTTVQAGSGKGIVFATGMKTQIGRTADLTQTVAAREIPIRREIDHFTRTISAIALVMGAVVFLISDLFLDNPFWSKLIFAIGIIVANVPEGLLPTVTLCLSIAAKRMAGKNALVKNLESVETLGCTTVICTDKTGTLTQNRMQVARLFLNECIHSDADAKFEREELEKILTVATLCNNAHLKAGDQTQYIGDPTEGALLVYAQRFHDVNGFQTRHKRLFEEPFTTATKFMVTINEVDGKQMALLKGAPDVTIKMCSHILINGTAIPMTEEHRSPYLSAYGEFARRAERVLLFAYKEVETRRVWSEEDLPCDGFIFAGLISMLDPPRPEVAGAIRVIREAGIRVIMVTGDYQVTAEAIGRMVGLIISPNPTIVTSEELLAMGDVELEWKLENHEVVFARTSPEQKLRIVQALQRHGEVVAVTGDGVNDAPALKQADIGVAMGLSGTDVARDAADMVLMDDNFATLEPAIKEGRTIFDNLRKSISYTIAHLVPEVAPYLAFILFAIPLPLTITLILSIDLGTDMLPAVALGCEQAESDVMQLPPRSRKERLVTGRLLLRAYCVNGLIEAAAGFYAYFSVLFAGGWRWGVSLNGGDLLYCKAVSAFFAAIVICQVANGLASKTQRQSLLRQGILSNRWLLFGIVVEFMLAGLIIETDALHLLFGNASLTLKEFFLAWPFAVGLVVLDGLRRFLIRRNARIGRKLYGEASTAHGRQ